RKDERSVQFLQTKVIRSSARTHNHHRKSPSACSTCNGNYSGQLPISANRESDGLIYLQLVPLSTTPIQLSKTSNVFAFVKIRSASPSVSNPPSIHRTPCFS